VKAHIWPLYIQCSWISYTPAIPSAYKLLIKYFNIACIFSFNIMQWLFCHMHILFVWCICKSSIILCTHCLCCPPPVTNLDPRRSRNNSLFLLKRQILRILGLLKPLLPHSGSLRTLVIPWMSPMEILYPGLDFMGMSVYKKYKLLTYQLRLPIQHPPVPWRYGLKSLIHFRG
jgi:hypothetical protein